MNKKFIKLGKEQVIGIKKVDKKNARIVSVCVGSGNTVVFTDTSMVIPNPN